MIDRRWLVLSALAGLALQCTPRPDVQPINARGWTNEPPAYEMVKSTTPNPFTRPGCRIVLEGIDYDKLLVGKKTAAQYTSAKEEAVAGSFDQDLDDASRMFADAIKEGTPDLVEPGGASDNTFTLRPRMTKWEPGFKVPSLGGLQRDSEMTIVVDVVDSGGNVLDEIAVSGTAAVHDDPVGIDFTLVRTGGAALRMHNLATRLGKNVSRYIREHWSCRAP